jgi:hypothetical protein
VDAEPKLGRRTRAVLAVLSVGWAFVLAGACLPDLAAFPDAPDASDAAVTFLSSICGDGVIDVPDDGGDGGESCDPGDASSAGCEDCRFTCSGAIDDAGHCYFFADPTQSYRAALSACSGAAGHVVTFASARESSFVRALAGDASSYWVGLTQRLDLGGYFPPSGVNEPGWPSSGASCPGCFAVGADDAGGFVPESQGGELPTCLVAEDGGWLLVACDGTKTRTTLCEREPVGQRIYPCGGLLCTTLPATASHKRYVVWPLPDDPERARELCETTYDGGKLVMFDSAEEREQLARELRQRLPLPLEVWIGLSKDGGWAWDDGDPLASGHRPLPWAEGQPGTGGGRAFLRIVDDRVDTQLAQSDDGGVTTRVFVCQRPL